MLSLLDLKRVVGHVGAPSANNYVVHLSVWETETSIANNTSTVRYKMWITAENDKNVTEYDGTTKYMSGWSVDGAQLRATINLAGKQVAQTTAYYTLYWNRSWQNSAELIAEGSTTVTHNPDGNLNMSITATLEQLNNYAANPSNGTISTSGWLDYIPRASTATLDKTTLTADGSSVKLTIAKATSSFTTTLTWKYGNSTGTLLNKSAATTATFTPDPADLYGQGTSGKVYFYLYTYNGNTQIGDTQTYEVALTIPAVSTIKATDAAIGSVSTVTVSRNSTAYTHSVYYVFSNLSQYITSNGGVQTAEAKYTTTSIPFTVPTSFYAKLPDANSGEVTVYVKTYYVNKQVGSTQSGKFKATVTDSNPTISGKTAVDQNSTTVALTGNSAVQVRYFSNTKFGFTASAKNSASIEATSIGGVSTGKTTTPSRTINGYDGSKIEITTTDSRGNVATGTIEPSIINYVRLTNNYRIYRPQPTDGSVRIVFSGDYWAGNFGAASNHLQLFYRWKENGGTYTQFVEVTPTISGNKYTATVNLSGYDYKKKYVFQVDVRDRLIEFYPEFVLREGIPVYDWGKKDFNFNVPVKSVQSGSYTHGFEARSEGDESRVSLTAGKDKNYGIFNQKNGQWIIYQTDGKESRIPNGLILKGHSSEIGTVLGGSGNATVSSGTTTNVASLNITAGKWLVFAVAQFYQNSNGARELAIHYGSGAAWNINNSVYLPATPGGEKTKIQVVTIFEFNSDTVIKTWVYQNSGAGLGCESYIGAIRIQ